MKDLLGNDIAVLSTVVFGSAGSMSLRTGVVIKINEKTVTIKHTEYNNGPYSTIEESKRRFDDVVVIHV